MPRNAACSSVCLAAALVGTAALLALYFAGSPWFAQLNLEDGPIEWATVILSLLAAAAAFYSASGHRARLIRLGVGLSFFFIAGEEISWGQRIFMFQTPEPLAAINVQSEFTLHNINGVHGNFRAVGLLILILAFVVAPIMSKHSRRFRSMVERINLPFFDLHGLAVLGLALLLMAVPRALGAPTVFDEFGELLISLSFLIYGLVMVGHESALAGEQPRSFGGARSMAAQTPSETSQSTKGLQNDSRGSYAAGTARQSPGLSFRNGVRLPYI